MCCVLESESVPCVVSLFFAPLWPGAKTPARLRRGPPEKGGPALRRGPA